jgi:hypothetical protein
MCTAKQPLPCGWALRTAKDLSRQRLVLFVVPSFIAVRFAEALPCALSLPCAVGPLCRALLVAVRFLFTLHGKVFFAVRERTAKVGCTATSIFPLVIKQHIGLRSIKALFADLVEPFH